MGAPVQQPVYYDTEQGQYYTMNTPQKQSNNSVGNLFGQLFANTGMRNADNPFYASQMANRNYLGSPYSSTFADRFTPKNIPSQYPEMNMLFPALNTGLLQGITSSIQPDGAMAGAGRFLSPQTTNTQGK